MINLMTFVRIILSLVNAYHPIFYIFLQIFDSLFKVVYICHKVFYAMQNQKTNDPFRISYSTSKKQ